MLKTDLNTKILDYWVSGYSVEDIASTLGIAVGSVTKTIVNSAKSISSKPANKGIRVTKADLVDRIAGHIGAPRDKVVTLEKANHEALELVLSYILNNN